MARLSRQFQRRHYTCSLMLPLIAACVASCAEPATRAGANGQPPTHEAIVRPSAAGAATESPTIPLATALPTVGSEGATEPATAIPPPPAERAASHMSMTHSEVRSAGQRIAFAIIADVASARLEYGISGRLERWDGRGWIWYADFGSSRAPWRGGLVSDGGPLEYPAVALVIEEGARFGPLEWLDVPALPQGWFRLVRDTALFVGTAPFMTVPTLDPDSVTLEGPDSEEDGMSLAPSVIHAPSVVRAVAGDGVALSGDWATVQSFANGTWLDTAVVAMDTAPVEVVGHVNEAALTLPALSVGVHRVVAQGPTGQERLGFVLVL